MNNEMALKMVCESLGFDIGDKNIEIPVNYLPGDISLFSKKGSFDKYGHSVGAYRNYDNYYAISFDGVLYSLESEEEQTDMGCSDYGITKECNSIGIQLSSIGIIPKFIILDEFRDEDPSGNKSFASTREITVWSF